MPDPYLQGISVRPIRPEERQRFDDELDRHHWLGHNLVGETMRHVAVAPDGTWAALLGFGAAALACRPREQLIGWSDETHFRRLRYIVNNQRYCVLPGARRANLASAVLARSLARLCGDYQSRWGHPVLVVETFVDPARHVGTCYTSAGFRALGQTRGFGRQGSRAGERYVHHGSPKLYFARPLRRDAYRILAAGFDHPALNPRSRAMIDLERLDFDSAGGLLARLGEVPDHRKPRGARHSLASILAIATAATLAGARSVAAIGEYAADLPQPVLARLGATHRPLRKRYIVPHEETFRRVLGDVDTGALDQVVGAWLFDQVRSGAVTEEQLVLALDGKAMRGALRENGKAVHLFSAMVHCAGIVVGQEEVDEKSNEITAFRPLLADLDLTGALVTADAMHCQTEHARFVVEDKGADYLFQVKENQPKLLEALRAIPEEEFSPEHETTDRGHGRTEHRYFRVADAPEGLQFPHISQVVVAYRERGDLADAVRSAETSYYITSASKQKAGAERLGGHTRGHWGIENKVHWVRDWAYDEDRHQLRSTNTARALATLRNLAISLLRLAGATNITAALRWVGRDAERAAALLGA